VNIALIKNGEPIFGLIASPVQEQVLLGSKETGVFIFDFQDWQAQEKWIKITPPLKTNYPLVMACSRSHHSGPVLQIIHQLQNEGQSMEFIKKGSALKFFDLAKGSADIYPRFAPTMEWDIAAGQAILEALGGEVIHAETGEPLRYNKANLVNPYFIARTKAMKESKR
jgi:3'(2'), 5'-bisphosphate nucleotidase